MVRENRAMTEKILLSWSGGKDSSLTLYELQRAGGFEIAALLTTVTREFDRISMHGVRRVLLEQQVTSLGLPLRQVLIPPMCANVEYEQKMGAALAEFQAQGVTGVAFGDIFLEDLRAYREQKLTGANLRAIFPIWKRDSRELAESFIALGFRAVVVCVDPKKLDPSFVGAEFSNEFLSRLPPSADPCGENGEFHTFVYDGPIFQQPIPVSRGQIVERDGFWFADLLPAAAAVP